MRKQSFRLALLINCWLVFYNHTFACGPQLYYDDARFSLFNPWLTDYPQLMAFQYTQGLLHDYNQDDLWSDRVLNCREWQSFAHDNIDRNDIDAIQYRTASDSFLAACNSRSWGAFAGNTFIKWLRSRKHKKALAYFAFAKAVEGAQDYETNDWGEEFYKTNVAQLDSLSRIAYKMLHRKLPQFLKERYAFQYVKCRYYVREYNQDSGTDVSDARKIFEQYLSGKESIVAQWGLIYYADMQDDGNLSTYYLLQAFDKCEEKKVRAFKLLSYEGLDSLEQTTHDNKTLVLIHAVRSMMHSGRGLSDIKYIYERDPENKYLPLLITREINKLEDWIWSPEILKFSPQISSDSIYSKLSSDPDKSYGHYVRLNFESDKKYLKDVLGYLLQMRGNFKRNNFLNLALAHLYNMDGQYANAKKTLQDISYSNNAVVKQYLIESAVAIANTDDLSAAATQQKLADHIKRLQSLGYRYKESNAAGNGYQAYGVQDENNPGDLYAYLGRRFQAAGLNMIASLLIQKSNAIMNEYVYSTNDSIGYAPIAYLDKIAAPEDIDAVIALKHKKNKTDFEQLISPGVWGADNMYLDLKGTLLVRAMKFKEALAVFDKMPDDFWEQHYEYRNYLPIASVTDLGTLLPAASGSGLSYNKSSKKLIVKEIVALQEHIENATSDMGKKLYTFQLANALYNISYYGTAWMVSAYGQSSSEPYSNDGWDFDYHWVYYYMNPSATNHVENYYGLQSAIHTYKKALSLSADDKELAAKCILMLALCDDIEHHYQALQSGRYNYYNDTAQYTSPYIRQLGAQYAHTAVFRNAVTGCPDINAYFSE